MKKIVTFIVILSLVFSLGTAYALNWTAGAEEKCDEYNISIEKFEKIESDIGTAYVASPGATAAKRDLVYFQITALDAEGENIEVEIELHDLQIVKAQNDMNIAKVTGYQPWVKVSKTEKTSLRELYFNGDKVAVSGNSVTIGDLTFIREKDVVTDVYFDGYNLDTIPYVEMADLQKELTKLNMTVQEIIDRKVCMSDDVLIANFGKICKTEEIVYWYVPGAESPELGIPKTGDKPLFSWISWLWGK